MLHSESHILDIGTIKIIETEFYYTNNTKICIGDIILFNGMNKEGTVSYIKGALCITFFESGIPDILFYNMYIHDNNVIKAFNKITNK